MEPFTLIKCDTPPARYGEAKRNFEFVGKDKRQTAGVIVERNEQKLRGGEV